MPDELENAALPLLEEMDKAMEVGSGEEMNGCVIGITMFSNL